MWPRRSDPVFASPNHGPRRDGLRPALVVIHTTCMASCADSRARLCDPAAEVSAHYLIDLDGRIEQLVDERQRAWHAGAGAWQGLDDINSRSIGIELQNTGDQPFPEPQMAALESLLHGIMARWNIPPQGVIAHSDMAPGRKTDPGPRFDWQRLARQGLAIWPDAPGEDLPLAASLDTIGYPPADEHTRLAAFRLRFRSWANGPEAPADRRIAAALVRALA
ncbi:MAG: N-acetylmuramoyl-L-alanine amidase [Paracoccus sp. (in: a-proteobacteria)]|uniref:N-acetylmuramoyl-L-alanine amidase n=1 Tax=Paracoccus sp. TaxID=267 RepID=UPI0026DFDE1B|nr:N-acetylmuramoyl-L-alanine amidase [Paracoccus sp. (in: a-proteobacteria)]MDO5621311.1 N-acetylmuramoyl-L-alanine amidase [Paracoccus sp. (in: a-proteobacteria)]